MPIAERLFWNWHKSTSSLGVPCGLDQKYLSLKRTFLMEHIVPLLRFLVLLNGKYGSYQTGGNLGSGLLYIFLPFVLGYDPP